MQSPWDRLIGTWTTEGSHPYLPGADISGYSTFEWLAGRQFAIWRSHYDHPDIPDAIAIIGTDGTVHYFDYRGVRRVLKTSIDEDGWRFSRDDPGFAQRYTGTFTDNGATIVGQGEMARDGGDWEADLAVTYRRVPARRAGDLDQAARRIVDANHYLTLGTTDPDGRPRLSPVYYTPARYVDFYWVSSPDAQHSRNLTQRPEVEIVIYDSTAPVSEASAAYMTATARAVSDEMLEAACGEAFRTTAGARMFTPDELRGGDLRLYVAHATSCAVHA